MKAILYRGLLLSFGGLLASTLVPRSEPVLRFSGVCDISQQAISCWDTKGVVSPALTEEVKDRLEESSDVCFSYGAKNRYAITRHDEHLPVFRYSTRGQGMMTLPKAGADTLIALKIRAAPGVKTQVATITVEVVTGKPVDVPLREGVKATVEDVKVTLGGPQNASVNPFRTFYGYPWRFGVDRTDTEPTGNLSFKVLDHKRNVIQFVDGDGKPVAPAVAQAAFELIKQGKWDWQNPTAAIASIQDGALMQLPGPWLYMNVDPKWIGALRIQRVVNHEETFGPFPLDPVQSSTP